MRCQEGEVLPHELLERANLVHDVQRRSSAWHAISIQVEGTRLLEKHAIAP